MFFSKRKHNNHGSPREPFRAEKQRFDELVGSHRDLSRQFFELTHRLRKKFDISKGVLVLRQEQPPRLAAVSTWKHGQERDGLALNLPHDSSLFEKVAEQGQVYTENFCDAFAGNFFERKLLLDDSSRSFVLQPLKANGRVVGVLGYSSEEPTAFAVCEEGILEEETREFASLIETLMFPTKDGTAT
jgi:hypothetical protein